MPSITTLTIDDRESTPVSHTYVPSAGEGSKYQSWVSSNGVIVADKRLALTNKMNGTSRKTGLVFADPIVADETINGVTRPLVIRSGYAELRFTFSVDSTLQERANLVGKIHNVTAPEQVFMMKVLQDGEGWW
jgi:hypothetical protein